MQFNSFFYIFIFLPVVILLYFRLTSSSHKIAKLFLVIASLFFYGWWNPKYIPLLATSILVNYTIAQILQGEARFALRKYSLLLGIAFNVALLAYFKYTNFFIDNINIVLDAHFEIESIVLPLGISFFTFTQIAFLVDTYYKPTKPYSLIDYSLFVSYFPHLLAGPIIHHAQVMPQFNDKNNAVINYKNIYFGLLLFIIGLTKKVVIADTFAIFANQGYEHVSDLQFTTAWATSLAYTFQLYFDFSGYTDMAIGASRMLNITLPINFNSPYKSLSIREFWHRWHITLSDFLRDYIYIPLGGNRVSSVRVYGNLFITFLIGGIWHGAGWTYVIWGALHGFALCVHRLFLRLKIKPPKLASWLLTFLFVNFAWIFFRATSLHDAAHIIRCMLNFTSLEPMNTIQAVLFALTLLLVVKTPNSNEIIEMEFPDRNSFIPIAASLFLLSIISMEISSSHAFIYFQF